MIHPEGFIPCDIHNCHREGMIRYYNALLCLVDFTPVVRRRLRTEKYVPLHESVKVSADSARKRRNAQSDGSKIGKDVSAKADW